MDGELMRRLFLTAALLISTILFPHYAFATVSLDSFACDTVGTNPTAISFTPGAGTRAIILQIVIRNDGTDQVTGATYGGVAMVEAPGSPILHNTGETGSVYVYFLGSGIPTGTQTVAPTFTETTTYNKDYCVTSIAAALDTEIVATGTVNSDSQANPSVTLGISGRTSYASIAFISGQDAITGNTQTASWTTRRETDFGTTTSGFYTYDTYGSSDIAAGYTSTAEDSAMHAIAVSEKSLIFGDVLDAF